MIIYKNIPCPVLLKEKPNTFLIFFKNEQKWIFKCSLGYGEIEKNKDVICYSFNGNLHREDGPAIECTNGSNEWLQNGKYHRLDGPACEYNNGIKRWYKNGKLHREGGPAVEHPNGDKIWYQNGKFHREDGPAVEYSNGSKEWFIYGEYIV